MEIILMEEGHFSRCSSTTSIDDDYIGYALNNWSPLADDWAAPFHASPPDEDFHGLIESMMCDDVVVDDEYGFMGACYNYNEPPSLESSVPSSTTTSSPSTPPAVEEEDDSCKGLRLVHLLVAAAEALSGGDAHQSRDLARVILVRLRELVSTAADHGGCSNIERLAPHFTDAMQALLDTPSAAATGGTGSRHHREEYHNNPSDVMAAFQLLQDMSPCVKFGHFTANQAIIEAVGGYRRVHVIDYDIMEGVQWASLMQALVSRADGNPPPHLRITAVTRGGGGSRRNSITTVQETGRRLAAFAASIGQPFSFSQCRLDVDEKFRPSTVKTVKGEAVVVNCMLHLPHSPHRAPGSISSFLAGVHSLNPKIITLVEEEEEEEETEKTEFVGKFMETLHRYSAVCDAMEAGFPLQGRARGLVEKVFLAPRIAGAVGRAYRGGGDGSWGDWLAAAGFGRVGISCFNHCQARLLLGLFNDGYRVEEAAVNKLVLAWKSRKLLSASVWSSPAPPCTVAEDGRRFKDDFFCE